MVGLNMFNVNRDRFPDLREENDDIDRIFEEATSILDANNIGMMEPLVDAQGSLRSDIDVYQVRRARIMIISTMVGLNMDTAPRDRVLALMEEKDTIEEEIEASTAVLEENNIGMVEPLVDAEGFPRSDIDVFHVRRARALIIRLQTIHKKVMRLIEEGLADVHANHMPPNLNGFNVPAHELDDHEEAAEWDPEVSNENDDEDMEGVTFTVIECFAVIGLVEMGSPADIAGLMEYDQLLQFGSVNCDNFKDINQLHEIVSHSVGHPIAVRVKRNNNVVNLTLVPKPWEKPGLLGCQMRRQLSIQVHL